MNRCDLSLWSETSSVYTSGDLLSEWTQVRIQIKDRNQFGSFVNTWSDDFSPLFSAELSLCCLCELLSAGWWACWDWLCQCWDGCGSKRKKESQSSDTVRGTLTFKKIVCRLQFDCSLQGGQNSDCQSRILVSKRISFTSMKNCLVSAFIQKTIRNLF